MTAPTHISFAGFLYLLLLTSAGVPLGIFNGITVLVASVLPDIDTGASTIGRLLPWASRRLERRFGHRTLTHSLPFTAALAVVLIPLAAIDTDIYACFLAGYASHPLLDSCTVTGVRLLYPVSGVRCVFPMDVNEPMRYRINTGTRQETILAVVFLLACIPSFFVAYQGLQRFVRVTRGNIEAAVKDYAAFSPSNLVWVECTARNLFSKELLAGRFRVIGALDDRTLVIRTADGDLRTLGKEFFADYAAEHAVCRRGEPAKTVVERIDMAGRRAADVITRGETHLFGMLVLPDEMARPTARSDEDGRARPAGGSSTVGRGFATITASGKELRLNYASPEDLARLIGPATIESGVLDVRHVIADSEPVSRSGSPPADVLESLKLSAGAELLFVCAPGDTIPSGGLLAAWDEEGGALRDLAEARKGIAALRMSRREKAREFAEKEGRLGETVRSDSIAREAVRTLFTAGFVPESAVRDAEARLRMARYAHGALASERAVFQAEMESKDLALQNRLETLESRLVAGAGRKELRSRNGGVVRSVERKDSRIRITVGQP